MSKKLILLFSCALLIAGCSPFRGVIVTNVKEPGVVDEGRSLASYDLNTGKGAGSKIGEGSVVNILGLFAFGDASVEGPAREAGITSIHTIDSEVFNFIGIFQKWTIKVTGE